MSKIIAIIGTGIMGSGIASNYLKRGYEVVIWNRTPEKTHELKKQGATLAPSPYEAAIAADIIFEVTADKESSRAVWQGVDGILRAADRQKIFITSATLSIDWVDELASICSQQDLKFFDMPLTGGRVAAENGSLTLLVGGNEADFETLKPDLEAISSKQLYFGPNGSGMKYKLILNSLQAAHIEAFGEAMKLAKKVGLPMNKVGEALRDRPGGVVTDIAWQAYQKADIPLTFSVNWISKDLSYAKQMAAETDLPVLDDVIAAYKKAQSDGLGEADWTTIIK